MGFSKYLIGPQLEEAKTEELPLKNHCCNFNQTFKGPSCTWSIPQISVCPSSSPENRYRNRMVTFLNTFLIRY